MFCRSVDLTFLFVSYISISFGVYHIYNMTGNRMDFKKQENKIGLTDLIRIFWVDKSDDSLHLLQSRMTLEQVSR